MIKSFKNKHTQAIYEGKLVKKWQSFVTQAQRRLQILDSATCLDDLKNLPSNRFESLGGDRQLEFSIRINKQWRVCFQWQDNHAFEVEIVDYH